MRDGDCDWYVFKDLVVGTCNKDGDCRCCGSERLVGRVVARDGDCDESVLDGVD